MTIAQTYSEQVDLLLTVLGDVVKSPDIALKGGTAINLFWLDLPRLSVDIDLTFLPILPRQESLNAIDNILQDIVKRLAAYPFLETITNYTLDGLPKQLLIKKGNVSVKVELNLVLRGAVFSPIILQSCSKAKSRYRKEVAIQCLSFEDLYAGKFCAALDRQHPRDLFDVHYFFKQFEITEKLKRAFITYLISTNRPIHEILQPSILNQQNLYEQEFEYMTDEPITYPQLEQARLKLIKELNKTLNQEDKEFLLAFEKGEPRWHLLPIPHASELPAVKWKLYNIMQMAPKKRDASSQKLKHKLCLN